MFARCLSPRPRSGLLCLLALLLFLTACAASAPPPATPPAPPLVSPTVVPLATPDVEEAAQAQCDLQGELVLGAVHSFSGPARNYGDAIRMGIDLAVEQINQQRFIAPAATLQVRYLDDESDPAVAASAFQTLVDEDEMVAILGPTLSTAAFSADPIAQGAGVPVMGTSNTADGITEMGSYIFRNSLPEAAVIPNTINAVREAEGLERVAIFYGEDDRFTEGGFEVMQRSAEAQGLEVVAVESFSKGASDFAAQLARIQAAEPDAILVSALVDEGAAILTQLRAMGLEQTVIGGNGFNSQALIAEAGAAAEGLVSGAAWFIDTPSPENNIFVESFRAMYGSDPDQFAAQAYTGTWLYATALREACSTNRVDLRNALAELRLIPTPLGAFSFTTQRNPLHPPVVLQVRDGRFALYQ